MKSYQVIIQPSGERHINEACEWLAGFDAEVATRWYDRLMELILSLAMFPERAHGPLNPNICNVKSAKSFTDAANINTGFSSP